MATFVKKRSISIPLVLNGFISALVLAIGMTPTFGAFTASITGEANSANAGTIVMQETDSSGIITCLSTDGGEPLMAVSCSAINKFGGETDMTPGDSATVVTTIRNVGSLAASSFSLIPGACVQSATVASAGSATDLCSRIAVSIMSGSSTIFSGTAATLGDEGPVDLLLRLGLPRVSPGLPIPIAVTTSMDAAADNTYQGLKVSQPLTWTFTA